MKTTVFGIKRDNQDLFNQQHLAELINKTTITRKFEEIVGEKKYNLHLHEARQLPEEKAFYQILMSDFMSVCYDYYTSTGNARKESGLRLVRQMAALIKATSIPHKMKTYKGKQTPAKFTAIADLINSWPNEIVTLGTTLKETADAYIGYIGRHCPNRKLFYIDGEMPVPARKKVLAQLKLSRNGLLIATQQSLKSSMNIPFCNKVIVESLQWNIPKISQFFFRFIRFDSPRHTDVYFVNYMDTIEINLMALLMNKERLNDFMKTTNQASTEDIYSEFGIDINILDLLMQKNYDENGRLYLTWGQQKIAA